MFNKIHLSGVQEGDERQSKVQVLFEAYSRQPELLTYILHWS